MKAIDTLLAAALLDGAMQIQGDEWVLPNWGAYQEVDATAGERKRRQREKDSAKVTPLPSHRRHA